MSEATASRLTPVAAESAEAHREPAIHGVSPPPVDVPGARRLTARSAACDISILILIVMCELLWLGVLGLGLGPGLARFVH